MKVFALLFFAVFTPVVVFLSAVLFGGISNSVVKDSLAEAKVYQRVSELISNSEGDDAESEAMMKIVEKRLTPEYLQDKIENTIDVSLDWITGKTSTPPTVSFKEIKEDITSKNPELLKTLEKLPEEMKDQEGQSEEDAKQMQKNMESFQSLVKSDFSLKLDSNLQGFKNFYGGIKIVLPILILLLIGSLALIKLASPSWNSFFKWLGATFLISGLMGFGVIFLSSTILTNVTQWTSGLSIELANIVAPIVLEIIKNFLGVYKNYQTWVSMGLIILGALSFAKVMVTKNTVASPKKPAKKK
jgi:hypothetical protein